MEIPNAFNYKASVPDISEVVKYNGLRMASDLNCMRIATVEEVHYEDLTVSVKLLNKRTLGQNADGTPNVRDYALIRAKICYCSPFITFPISVGDDCVLLFSDREIESWFINGDAQPVNHQRMHDLTDAFAIFGIRSLPKMIELTDAEKNGVFIQSLHAKNGVSGTFVSKDNKTVTVVDGIITGMTGGSDVPSVTADEIIDALGYTPASTELSNLSSVGKKVIDGSWVDLGRIEVGNQLSPNGSSPLPITLSNIPNDGFEYEALISAIGETTTTSGQACICYLKSDKMEGDNGVGVCLFRTIARSNAAYYGGGTAILPLSTSRKIYLYRTTSYHGKIYIYLLGYRRIGTNS